ncbi:hypothetical protein AB433_08595 [Croceicoccus naphthovorans]|uniref:Peptidase M3A/M3B catalytic domain-containing protein n=1 Tax=Croceicoccus naphthovorans TaxID=1348774 RepID=A0A0G3XKE3_9SPHN|nr:hypothetical protein AB433_08595 [Croceicoccus naphthovorans]
MADAADAAPLAARCDAVLSELDRRLAAMEKQKGPSTVDTTLRAYDDMTNILNSAWGEFAVYREVMLDAERRAAGSDCETRLEEFEGKMQLSRPLYDRLNAIDASGEDAATQLYLKEIIASFDRNGVGLSEDKRAKVAELKAEIADAGAAFDRNIAESDKSIKVLPSELAGMPEDFLEAHPVGEDGLITLTTKSTDWVPIRSYAESDLVRERLMRTYYSSAYPENDAELRRLFNARDELAKLLGRPNYAAMVLEDKMLTTPEEVAAQIDKVATAALPAAQSDIAIKQAMLQKIKPGDTLDISNGSYVSTQVKKDRFALDPQEVRQYFTYDKVRDGTFQLVEDLFQVDIEPWDTSVWHEDVQTYKIVDRTDIRGKGKLLGYFYLDSHPRDGKYTHANHVTIRRGIGDNPAISALVQNLPKGGYDTGLMEHRDVETFLHEFGHLIHNILGGGHKWYGQNGVATERDFVEAPSQMLENWVYDYDTLAKFAKNEQGEVIPRELVEKMQAARYFGNGENERTQAGYANASLRYHLGPAPENISDAYREWVNAYAMLPFPENTHNEARFGHLNGYSAVYYTYGWSRVIAADMFTRFEEAGLRVPQVAMDYRTKVLGGGGTKPAAQLVEDFLGRPISFDAFGEQLKKGGEAK